MKRLVRSGAVLLLSLLIGSPLVADPRPEVRAMWVVRTTLTSPASVTAMVSAARAGGFNTLFVQVRGRGDAYYRSGVEPQAEGLGRAPAGFDPLALVLAQAKAAGLSVHAWVNVNLVADATALPVSKKHVLWRHPDWLMVPRDLVPELGRMSPKDRRFVARLAAWTRGQSASVEGLYCSPLHDGVADYVAKVVGDLVSRYPLDGVHLDYARYPGVQFDFSRAALDVFASDVTRGLPRRTKQELKRAARANPLAYVDRYPASWEAYKRNRLTALLRRVTAAVRARRPGAMVSAAVVPDVAAARDTRGQDWPAWLAQGLLDAVCPMAYTTDADVFRQQIAAGRAAAAGRPLYAGIGAYRLSEEQTLRHIQVAREAGADGVVLFSYSSMASPERGADFLTRLGRAAFGR